MSQADTEQSVAIECDDAIESGGINDIAQVCPGALGGPSIVPGRETKDVHKEFDTTGTVLVLERSCL